MRLPLLLLSTIAATVHAQEQAPARQPAQDAGIRVWLSSDGDYLFGDRARVFVETSADGYVVVLHVDTDGRVRPLFPVDPGADHYLRGHRKLEVKGRGDREAFVVADTMARGAVIAAYAPSAFGFAAFTRNGHWDYRSLVDTAAGSDPEAYVLDVLRRMQPSERFVYDVAPYTVGRAPYARRPGWGPWPRPRPGWWWDDGYYRPRTGISIGAGQWYAWPYHPYYRDRLMWW